VVRCRVEEEGALQLGEEGNVIEFVAALVHRREGKEWRKGGPRLCSGLRRRGGDRQAPRGHRGAQRRGQRGEATAAARGRATRGERAAGVERRRGRAGTRGDALSPAPEVKWGRAGGVQRKKKGKRDQGLICKTLKAQGSIGKLKIPSDLRIK
jgi:hypothetical protein